MKITRFVNGQKIDKSIYGKFLINKPLIADTIESVNHRLKANGIAQNTLKGRSNE